MKYVPIASVNGPTDCPAAIVPLCQPCEIVVAALATVESEAGCPAGKLAAPVSPSVCGMPLL